MKRQDAQTWDLGLVVVGLSRHGRCTCMCRLTSRQSSASLNSQERGAWRLKISQPPETRCSIVFYQSCTSLYVRCVAICLKKGPYASLKRDHPVSDNSRKYRAIYSTPRPSLLLLTQSFACSPSQHRLPSLAALSPRLLEAPNSDSFRRCHLTFAPRDGACLVERSRAHEQLTDTDRVLGSNTICSRWE
jgi:hypothetical protein